MSYLLYSLALALAMLVSLPYWIYQMLRHGKYVRGFSERTGRVPARLAASSSAVAGRSVWVHAVSVGEVLAISGLVEEMRRAFPAHRILISTTTDTGQELARKLFGKDNVFYFPMDFAFAIRPFLDALEPELVVLAETEFWPNFLRFVHGSGARLAVVNGRISDRSWPRYSRFRWALGGVLGQVDLFLAQTEQDSLRLQSIGVETGRVRVTGNLKFDVNVPPSPAIVESLRSALAAEGASPVLVCGSTVEGEERGVLPAFEQVLAKHSHAAMILAPRHPERFEGVAALLQEMGIRWHRRSTWQGEPLVGSVLLLDSIGELASLYSLADVAFVGGSLVPRGGHNIIEPAQHGVAIVTGKHTENFRDIVALFQSRNAVRIVGMGELASTLIQLIDDDAERLALGRRAKETVQSQVGATSRTLSALQALLFRDNERLSASAQAVHTD